MFNPKYILIALVVTIASACGSPEEATSIKEGTSVAGTSAVGFRAAEVADNPSLFVFREDNSSYLLRSRHDNQWVDGKMELDLLFGRYKFFFAQNFGTNLKLPAQVTALEDMVFSLSQNESDPAYYASADELYLQDLPANANRQYDIDGSQSTTVSATLKRAVGQVNIVLKRVTSDGEDAYEPDPYGGAGNVMDMIGSIEMIVSDVGTSVGTAGGSGSGEVIYTINSYEEEDIDSDGFATLRGPFVIPPSSGPVTVDITVKTANDAEIAVEPVVETVIRNQQLVITLLMKDITVPAPKIYVAADVSEMEDEHEGGSGLWD